jgi:Flp pilus assembly protein TadG
MFARFATSARNFLHAEDGTVAIQLALTMVVLIGMGALAIDVGYALSKQRQMQSAADAAAFSAAVAKSTGHPAAPSTEALAVAGASGFVNGSNGVVVTFKSTPVNPPATAADAANASAVQVIITQSLTLPLVSAVCPLLPGGGCSGAFTVGAQAVASSGAGGGCAWQLSGTANPGVSLSNGAAVTLENCGLTACSTASTGNDALYMTGGTSLNLEDKTGALSSNYPASVAGAASLSNGAAINGTSSCVSPTCIQRQGACGGNVDPYAGVTMPTQSGCNYSNQQYGTPLPNMSPGTYCNVSFSYGTVTMSPGVYYINQGNFTVGGGVTLKGAGVTIVLTSSTGTNYATVNIANGVNVTLSAPTSGATSGIVFFGDRNAPLTNTSTFAGGATMNITGAIYMPTQLVQFSNGASNPSGCTQLVAGQIQFTGGANFSNNCAGLGTSGSGGGPAMLE